MAYAVKAKGKTRVNFFNLSFLFGWLCLITEEIGMVEYWIEIINWVINVIT